MACPAPLEIIPGDDIARRVIAGAAGGSGTAGTCRLALRCENRDASDLDGLQASRVSVRRSDRRTRRNLPADGAQQRVLLRIVTFADRSKRRVPIAEGELVDAARVFRAHSPP